MPLTQDQIIEIQTAAAYNVKRQMREQQARANQKAAVAQAQAEAKKAKPAEVKPAEKVSQKKGE